LNLTAIFWDVGGVLLSNAWDHTQRAQAVAKFQLDEIDFRDRHDMLVSSLERGHITLDQYMKQTVFYRPRQFTPEDFRMFMFSLSQPHPDALTLACSLSRSGKYLMATINNESRELNEHRIRSFGLRDIFTVFVSSCYTGLRKPEEGIYRMALDLTQRAPEECCFIDDRGLNLETAARLGIETIRMQGAAQLQQDLAKLGVTM
jgi:putative hydrolase of the HAD superfamily